MTNASPKNGWSHGFALKRNCYKFEEMKKIYNKQNVQNYQRLKQFKYLDHLLLKAAKTRHLVTQFNKDIMSFFY